MNRREFLSTTATSAVALARGEATDNLGNWPDGALQGQLRNALEARHLKYGYAGYWDAAAITWGTHEHLEVFPIWQSAVTAQVWPVKWARLAVNVK